MKICPACTRDMPRRVRGMCPNCGEKVNYKYDGVVFREEINRAQEVIIEFEDMVTDTTGNIQVFNRTEKGKELRRYYQILMDFRKFLEKNDIPEARKPLVDDLIELLHRTMYGKNNYLYGRIYSLASIPKKMLVQSMNEYANDLKIEGKWKKSQKRRTEYSEQNEQMEVNLII